MSFAAAIVSRISSLSPSSQHLDSGDESESIISSQGSCSSSLSSNDSLPKSLESSTSTSSCDAPQSVPSSSKPLRANEHLAVLLPKHLWKPDSQASCCDTFLCRKRFSIFERRHHCRKCGGVFCTECSSKGTNLLDATSLQFIHPPRGVPITDFASPTSPVVFARVCNECHDQIFGRTRSLKSEERSVPASLTQESSRASSPSKSPRMSPRPHRPVVRRSYTSPRIPNSPLRTSPPSSIVDGSHIADSDLGELAAYPLRHASAICKASGGGRWEPKPVNLVGYRPHGTKLPYEIELEREEEEKRRERENPIIIDGDFQLRVPKELGPRSLGGPITLSTF